MITDLLAPPAEAKDNSESSLKEGACDRTSLSETSKSNLDKEDAGQSPH